jgi:hypothetical protein
MSYLPGKVGVFADCGRSSGNEMLSQHSLGQLLETVGITSSRFESAKSYLNWGVKLSAPVVGCIIVFTRDGGGHVGFVTGADAKGNLLVLGSNQSDAVNIRAFARDRVAGYRWPVALPLLAAALPLSTAEASKSVT